MILFRRIVGKRSIIAGKKFQKNFCRTKAAKRKFSKSKFNSSSLFAKARLL
jgi:hypothetical protein